jgi:flagellar basal-body rod modification protein FlgD
MYTVGISETLQNDMQQERADSNIMGKDDFLALLVQQMKHQNPLEPMSNTEYAAQLAQYSSLEQLQQLNENAESQIILGQSLNNSFMTSVIGKEIKSFGDGVEFSGSDVDLHYNLSRDATDFEVKIFNESGELVRTLGENGSQSGDQSISWDGKNDDGEVVEEGNYHFEISAKDVSGLEITTQTYSVGVVDGISYHQGSPFLNINGQFVNLGDVISISSPPSTDSSGSDSNDGNPDSESAQDEENLGFVNRILNQLTRGIDGKFSSK